MKRRGVTLVELLVATAITALVMAAGSRAFVATVQTRQRLEAEDSEWSAKVRFEDKIRTLLRSAAMPEGTDRTDVYFLAYPSSNSTDGSLSDTVVFSALGLRPNYGATTDANLLESRNADYGPVGGLAEVSISRTPYSARNGLEGVFLREQVPADGNPDEGGLESLMWDQVQTLEFEFYDGTEWQPSWDTITDATLGLPRAVRVTYSLIDNPDNPVSFVVRVPAADSVLAAQPTEEAEGAQQ